MMITLYSRVGIKVSHCCLVGSYKVGGFKPVYHIVFLKDESKVILK